MTTMRATMLWNPKAAGVSPRVLDVIARALGSELKLDVRQTEARHHATELARAAAAEGYDAVVCLGGDGTLNEVINGLAGTTVPIIPLPAGGTNVFARSIGLPKDPIEATGVVIERLQEGAQPRAITLGRLNGRWFSFCSGIGIDAAIVRAVDRRARLKRRFGEGFFVAQGLGTWAVGFPHSGRPLRVELDGEVREGYRTIVACNADPYTYLGERPFRLTPGAALDRDLAVMASRSLSLWTGTRVILTAFGRQRHVRYRAIDTWQDVARMRVTSDRPMPWQVDGEAAGTDTVFEYESARDALWVLP